MTPLSNEQALYSLIDIFPLEIRQWLRNYGCLEDIVEIVADFGRAPEVRFAGDVFDIHPTYVTSASDIDAILASVSGVYSNNRAGLPGTLHRISVIRDRELAPIGITARVGRFIPNAGELIRDLIEDNRSLLILGPPGAGKTSKLREAARILADDLDSRVVIVDGSNEIAGDMRIPHFSVGRSRRLMVPVDRKQDAVMIEAVENHCPQHVIVDEISTLQEALAARTISQRGVTLLATVHGNDIHSLFENDQMRPLLGNIKKVAVSDTNSLAKGLAKLSTQREFASPFDTLVVLDSFDRVKVYHNLTKAVDVIAEGGTVCPELRTLQDGVCVVDSSEKHLAHGEANQFATALKPLQNKARNATR